MTTCGRKARPRVRSNGNSADVSRLSRSAARARWTLVLLFIALLAAFAAGLWGTVLRPPAYEVQGEFVARAAPDLILVRHTAISALGMSSMEQMAVSVSPAQVDPLGLKPGDRVRLGVRQEGEHLVLLRIERRP